MFAFGDTVKAIDKNLRGRVLSVRRNTVIVEDEYGFEHSFLLKELVLDVERVYSFGRGIKKDTFSPKKDFPVQKKTKKKQEIPFIDLHLDKKSFDGQIHIIEEQKKQCRDFLRKVVSTGRSEAIIVHGVGTGKLKNEVRKILVSKGFEFTDAPYEEFGAGATKVYFYYPRKSCR